VKYLNDTRDYRLDVEKQHAMSVKEFLFPDLQRGAEISVKAAGRRL
jgi:hypothetical protein